MLQHVRVVEVQDTLVGVLGEQASRTARALSPYFVKASRFLTFSARSRRVSGLASKATWQIRSKGSRSLAQFLDDGIERQALGRQFLDDGLLALGGVPAFQEVVEAGEALAQRALGEVAQGLGDELAVLVEVFHPLGDDRGADAVDIDLLLRPPDPRPRQSRGSIDGLVLAGSGRRVSSSPANRIVGRNDRARRAGS
jgi:hypothetical protein